ncbi:MAG: hypothetical protein PW734_06150 [Verrucomicrobium sp.]|nr:hypothetical protein [Verrucomicrobium sp.]
MNPTSQTSQAEAILAAVLDRFAAQVAPGGTPGPAAPLSGVSVGPYLGLVQGRKLPWLTVDLIGAARRRVTADDGQVETRATLDLTLADAAHGGHAALALAYRWAAWLESVLVPEGEAVPLDGLVDWIEPDAVAVHAGGAGFADFSVQARFILRYRTPLGAPFTT